VQTFRKRRAGLSATAGLSCFSCRQIAGAPPNLHTMVPRRACIQGVLNVKVYVKGHVILALCWRMCWRSRSRSKVTQYGIQLIWFHKNRFFSQANGCILTKLSLSLTSPILCPFGFLPHSNPQMAVSLRCEFRHSSHGETVCQTVCYTVTVRSHVLSLHALTLWRKPLHSLSFQYKYQAAKSNV